MVGGTLPYYFNWSNGSYNQNISGLIAGNYTVTVTDANSVTGSITVTLYQPNPIVISLNPFIYEGGYNISSQGGHDGSIEMDVSGGTQDFSYAWNTGSTESSIYSLSIGTYSVTLTDMNGCTLSASKTLTEPTALHVVSITSPLHYGYNVSCYEGRDGAINLNVIGGVPPYTYHWSMGSDLQNVSDLYAGHYSVIVYDANEAAIAAQIDLSQPNELLVTSITALVYPNGYNLSCNTCSNGSLTVNTSGGVSPLSYTWESGLTANPMTGIGAGSYFVTVTDVNGCTATSSKTINGPPLDAWSLYGNANSDSTTQYFGTSDSKPIIFKTNNTERIHVQKDGKIIFKDDVKFEKPLNLDTLKINRIMAQDGDSIVRLGIGSINFNDNNNNIYGTSHGAYDGLSIGNSCYSYTNGGIAMGNYSSVLTAAYTGMAIGNFVRSGAAGAIAIGNGFGGASLKMNNTIENSVMIGANSTIPSITIIPGSEGNPGFVGINTNTPSERVQLTDGSIFLQGENQGLIVDEGTNKRVGLIKYSGRQAGIWRTSGQGFDIGRVDVSILPGSPTVFNRDLYIDGNGKTYIGFGTLPCINCSDVNYKLYVEGSIAAREIKVTINNFPDYVLKPGYKLRSIYDLDKYIKHFSHLPAFKPASLINAEGAEVGKLQQSIVLTLEEQSLYIISLQEQIDLLKCELKQLEK